MNKKQTFLITLVGLGVLGTYCFGMQPVDSAAGVGARASGAPGTEARAGDEAVKKTDQIAQENSRLREALDQIEEQQQHGPQIFFGGDGRNGLSISHEVDKKIINYLIPRGDINWFLGRALVASASCGFMHGVEGVIDVESKNLLQWLIKLCKKGFGRLWHGDKRGVSSYDVSRWVKTSDVIEKSLNKWIGEVRQNAGIAKKMALTVRDESIDQDDVSSSPKSTTRVIDSDFQEIQALYLLRILQFACEVEVRKAYYNSSDEIVACLDRIKRVLVGNVAGVDLVLMRSGRLGVEEVHGLGGLMGRLAMVTNISDFLDAKFTITLGYLHGNLMGLLEELKICVQDKTDAIQNENKRTPGLYGGGMGSSFDN